MQNLGCIFQTYFTGCGGPCRVTGSACLQLLSSRAAQCPSETQTPTRHTDQNHMGEAWSESHVVSLKVRLWSPRGKTVGG